MCDKSELIHRFDVTLFNYLDMEFFANNVII